MKTKYEGAPSGRTATITEDTNTVSVEVRQRRHRTTHLLYTPLVTLSYDFYYNSELTDLLDALTIATEIANAWDGDTATVWQPDEEQSI